MNQLGGFPLLTLIVSLPLLGALVSLFVRPERREVLRWLALLIAASNLVITLFLYMGWVDDASGVPQFVDGPWTWVASLGIAFHLGVDGISLHLVALTAILTPLLMLSRWSQHADTLDAKRDAFWSLVLQAGLVGALTALDVLLLSLFWLVSLLAAFMLIGQSEPCRHAASLFMGAVAVTATALLAVTVGIAVTQASFDLTVLLAAPLPWATQTWMFWTAVVACSTTGAIFPFHLWYPPTHRQTSVAVRVMVGGLLLNLGTYGLIRLCLRLFPLAAASFAPAMVVLGTVGLLYGALAALGQRTASGALVYWRVAHAGMMVIGVFSMQNVGLHGAIVHLVACSLATAAALFLSGDEDGSKASSIAARAGGAAQALPLLSAIGVPGLIGFVGQALLVTQVVRWQWQPVEVTLGARLLDWAWRSLVFGGLLIGMIALLRVWPRPARSAGSRTDQQRLIVLPLLVLIVLLGIRPRLVGDTIGPSVYRLLAQLRLGVERDLHLLAPAQEPGEMQEQTPPAQDEGESAVLRRGPPVGAVGAALLTSWSRPPGCEPGSP